MVTTLVVTCVPTPVWPIVTFLPDQALPSDAMALDTLPVTAAGGGGTADLSRDIAKVLLALARAQARRVNAPQDPRAWP